MATSRRLQDKNGYINEEVKRVAVELCISVTHLMKLVILTFVNRTKSERKKG